MRKSEEKLALLFPEAVLDNWRRAKVLVIGLGGVGGTAALSLARSGVGRLTLIDFDVVEESNINRQAVATMQTLGQQKTAVLAAQIAAINPDCVVETYAKRAEPADLALINPDFTIEAIDDLPAKAALIGALLAAGRPFISAMGAGKRCDPEAVGITRFRAVTGDPLAKKLRKILAPGSDFPVVASREAPKGAGLGSFHPVTASFGLLLAAAALKEIGGTDAARY